MFLFNENLLLRCTRWKKTLAERLWNVALANCHPLRPAAIIVTENRINAMPIMFVPVKCSSKTITPTNKAVRGSRAPKMAAGVGPM